MTLIVNVNVIGLFFCHTGSVQVDSRKPDVQQHNQLYGHIPANHVPINLQASDPVFVNPNSYERVKEVLRHIGKSFNIALYTPGSPRKWCAVVCDGLPYVLAQKVIRETFICDCGKDGSKAEMEAHGKEPGHHATREFDWVLLQIGLGHVEMNFARAFLSLNWEVSVYVSFLGHSVSSGPKGDR